MSIEKAWQLNKGLHAAFRLNSKGKELDTPGKIIEGTVVGKTTGQSLNPCLIVFDKEDKKHSIGAGTEVMALFKSRDDLI